MNIGDLEPLREATLRVLSPRTDLRAEALRRWRMGQWFNRNSLATALLLAWPRRGVRYGYPARPVSPWVSASQVICTVVTSLSLPE